MAKNDHHKETNMPLTPLTKLSSHTLTLEHLFQYLLASLKGVSWLLFVLSPWMLLALGSSSLGIVNFSNDTLLLITALLLAGLPQLFLSRHHEKEDNNFSPA